MAHGHRPGIGRFFSGEHPHERRLARAIRTDQGNPIAPLDVQVQILEDDHRVSAGARRRRVRLPHVLQFEHRPTALGAGREREVDALPFGRHLDRHHLLQQLDPALHLRRLRRLVAEPVDEHFDARHFLILLALHRPQPVEHRVALFDVFAVVADVVGQLAQVEIGDAGDDGVEEVAVVRHENHGVGIRAQVLLEPVARIEIQVVRRFVEEQEIRAAEQQLGQGDPHLPAAGERLGRTIAIVGAEAEPAQHGRDPQVHAVALVEPEAILKFAVAHEHRVVLALRHAGIAKTMFDVFHLALHVEQRLEGSADFFENGAAAVRQPVLRQIADGERRRFDDAAGVGIVEPGQHLEQCGLAGAVRTAEADAVAVTNLPGDVVQQDAVAEGFGEVGKLNHSLGMPATRSSALAGYA